jgi:hypothetical protein
MISQNMPACAELAAMSQEPHDPFESLDQFPRLLKTYRDLPLYSALHLPRRLLKRRFLVRRAKDALLKRIIGTLCRGKAGWILNPCCVFARHARDIAASLPMAEILATDIDSRWERISEVLTAATFQHKPRNFHFRAESVYEATVLRDTLAVCFFGGCGSLTDAGLKLAIASRASFIAARACCHDNIGMNTQVSTRAITIWNVGHRMKNRVYRYCADRFGHYFHRSAAIDSYPMSRNFRGILGPAAMLRCAQHAVDCALCRTVIDLDRAEFLVENGYRLLGYHENMFVAARFDADLSSLDMC